MTFEGTLTVTDGFGNSDATNFTVTVRPAGHPLVYAGPDLQIAQGDTVNFTGTLKGPGIPPDYTNTTFNWTITGPTGTLILAGRNVTHTFPTPGVYQVVF